MSRSRKLFKSQAQDGVEFWRVNITRTVRPGSPPTLDVQCGGRSVADTIKLLKNTVALLEQKQTPASE